MKSSPFIDRDLLAGLVAGFKIEGANYSVPVCGSNGWRKKKIEN